MSTATAAVNANADTGNTKKSEDFFVKVAVASAERSVVTLSTGTGAVDVKVGRCNQDVQTWTKSDTKVHVGNVAGNVVTISNGGSANVSGGTGGTVGGGMYTLAIGDDQDPAQMMAAFERLRLSRAPATKASSEPPVDPTLDTDGGSSSSTMATPPTHANIVPGGKSVTKTMTGCSLDTGTIVQSNDPLGLPVPLRGLGDAVAKVYGLFLEVDRIHANLLAIDQRYEDAGNWDQVSSDLDHIQLYAAWMDAYLTARTAYLALPDRDRGPYMDWFERSHSPYTYIDWKLTYAKRVAAKESAAAAILVIPSHDTTDLKTTASATAETISPESLLSVPPPPSYEEAMACAVCRRLNRIVRCCGARCAAVKHPDGFCMCHLD